MNEASSDIRNLAASASKYAQGALDAHYSKDPELLAIFATTALEHITKACLVNRHPVLILNLQAKESWRSLLFLLGATDRRPTKLQTVSLRDALLRAEDLFESNANRIDLLQLIDIRDGAIHFPSSQSIEERLLIAFLRQVDASLDDLGVAREQFWESRLGVVNAILSEEANRVKRNVELRIQQAKLKFDLNLAPYSATIRDAILTTSYPLRENEAKSPCPACHSTGVALGERNHSLIFEEESPSTLKVRAIENFIADSFSCSLCGLELTSREEMEEAQMTLQWDIDVDPKEFSRRIEVLNFGNSAE